MRWSEKPESLVQVRKSPPRDGSSILSVTTTFSHNSTEECQSSNLYVGGSSPSGRTTTASIPSL